ILLACMSFAYFFFIDPATPEIYTLSLHDALPIYEDAARRFDVPRLVAVKADGVDQPLDLLHGELSHRLRGACGFEQPGRRGQRRDRKSTRLNSSHRTISYAVFCLKKKKNKQDTT